MAGKKKIIIGVAVVALIVAFAGVNFMKSKEAPKVAMPIESDLKVESRTIESKIYVNGVVVTDEERKINYDGTGVVDEVYVELGDLVKKDQLLAKINSDDLEHQLKTARINLEMEEARLADLEKSGNTSAVSAYRNAEISYNDAKKSYENTKELFNQGAASQSEVDRTKSAMEQAKSNYSSQASALKKAESGLNIMLQEKAIELQKLNLDKLERALEKTNIRSTIDGTITQINVRSGEAFERASHMFYVENFMKNVIKANISESEINTVSIGQTVEITGRSIKGERLAGTVTAIEPGTTKPQGSNQAYVQITIALDQIKETLRPDFAVNLVVQTGIEENAMAVPFEAVLNDKDGNKYVLVQQEDGTTKRVDVIVGLEGDLYVQILTEDLAEGDPLTLTENVPAVPPAQ